jgi:glutamyl/glutaminyl-tRNA synthetase
MSDIVKSFDLAAIHKSGAIVSEDRLAWLNKQHLRAGLSPIASGGRADLHAKARRMLTDAYGSHLTLGDTDSAIFLVRSRLNVVADVVSEARFLFEEPALQLPLSSADAHILSQFASALQSAAEANPAHAVQHAQQGVTVCQDSAQATAAAISALRAATKLKPPQLFPCIRLALTVRCALSLSASTLSRSLLKLCFLFSCRVNPKACLLQTLCRGWECSVPCTAFVRRQP